MAEIFLI